MPSFQPHTQITLDEFVTPADWAGSKHWGTLTINASCTPADITYPTNLKLLNVSRESTNQIIDDLCEQLTAFRKHQPRYNRGRCVLFSSVAPYRYSDAAVT